MLWGWLSRESEEWLLLHPLGRCYSEPILPRGAYRTAEAWMHFLVWLHVSLSYFASTLLSQPHQRRHRPLQSRVRDLLQHVVLHEKVQFASLGVVECAEIHAHSPAASEPRSQGVTRRTSSVDELLKFVGAGGPGPVGTAFLASHPTKFQNRRCTYEAAFVNKITAKYKKNKRKKADTKKKCVRNTTTDVRLQELESLPFDNYDEPRNRKYCFFQNHIEH